MNFNCIFLFLSIGSVKTSFSLIISPFGFTNFVNFPFESRKEREREREVIVACAGCIGAVVMALDVKVLYFASARELTEKKEEVVRLDGDHGDEHTTKNLEKVLVRSLEIDSKKILFFSLLLKKKKKELSSNA